VFASSIAVFGAMPDRVTGDTPLRPQMTYGTQKLVQRWHSASAPRATVQNCA
jgi:UDP-glucose 4-epimerase